MMAPRIFFAFYLCIWVYQWISRNIDELIIIKLHGTSKHGDGFTRLYVWNDCFKCTRPVTFPTKWEEEITVVLSCTILGGLPRFYYLIALRTMQRLKGRALTCLNRLSIRAELDRFACSAYHWMSAREMSGVLRAIAQTASERVV